MAKKTDAEYISQYPNTPQLRKIRADIVLQLLLKKEIDGVQDEQ